MNYYGVGTINEQAHGDAAEFVRLCEDNYTRLITKAAQDIMERGDSCPIILLSGPSGSGKTTSALRIEKLLDSWGHETHTVSMDNYFHRPPEWVPPLDEDGKVDLESPLCLDIELLNKHLEMIANCEEIAIPSFDFANQRRDEKTRRLKRKPGELVILEGIHSLNPDVTGTAESYSVGIYVSVRTRVVGRNGEILHPEKIRLLRRLIRDNNYRGQSYEETIERMASVNRGEDLYIMPHKQRAEIQIDTFLPYELGIYKGIAEDKLARTDQDVIEAGNARDLLEIVADIDALPQQLVPDISLVREFIGGSKLKY